MSEEQKPKEGYLFDYVSGQEIKANFWLTLIFQISLFDLFKKL